MPTITCPDRAVANRVPAERLTENPRCGRCGAHLFQGRSITLTTGNFDRHANAELPLLVDFWASWCRPCKMMAPQFEAAAHALEPHFRLGQLDTEAEQQIAGRYDIRGIPTMILFKSGREIARKSSVMSVAQTTQWARSQAQ